MEGWNTQVMLVSQGRKELSWDSQYDIYCESTSWWHSIAKILTPPTPILYHSPRFLSLWSAPHANRFTVDLHARRVVSFPALSSSRRPELRNPNPYPTSVCNTWLRTGYGFTLRVSLKEFGLPGLPGCSVMCSAYSEQSQFQLGYGCCFVRSASGSCISRSEYIPLALYSIPSLVLIICTIYSIYLLVTRIISLVLMKKFHMNLTYVHVHPELFN